jgi:replicative DNA helicase
MDAEKAVIGSILADAAALTTARDMLAPEFFKDSMLGRTFKVMLGMRYLDIFTVEAEVSKQKILSASEARTVLLDCQDSVASAGNVAYHARTVAENYYDRQILQACRDMAKNPDTQNLGSIEKLFLAKQGLDSSPLLKYETGLYDLVDDIVSQKREAGFKTGLPSIDRAWICARPGEINTWAAATNTGKSLMLLNLMDQAAKNGNRCLYVGTEMSARETAHRHLSILSGVEPWKMRMPKLNEEEVRRMTMAVSDRMSGLPISILDDPEPGLKDIEASIVAAKPQIVFLDYLERFSLPKEENMRLRVKEFMRQLKNLARRRNVVIHLASQLNRQAYGADEKRPTMAEISESSAVEKESDRIMIMWAPKAKQTVDHGRVLEVIQAKNRHGRRGIIFDLFVDERSLTISEWRDNEPTYAE